MRGPRRGWGWDPQREIIYGVVAVMMGLSLGIGLHAVTAYSDRHGPAFAGLAFNGNGALFFPCCVGPLLIVFGDALLARRRAYAALVLYPLALIAGFALMGGF